MEGPCSRCWMRPWIAGALGLILIVLSGCAEVQVVEPTPVRPDLFTSPLAAGQSQHNLAIMALDFDPPLSYQQIIVRREPVTLLVVIENRGAVTERGVMVRAELTSPQDSGLKVTQNARVASIAPGEIQIVRLARLKEIPFHGAYRLQVTIAPVAGELDLADNVKIYDVQVGQK